MIIRITMNRCMEIGNKQEMKKILLLGGSAQQVIAIETAKRLGYYTVLCDYLTDNPGQYVADKFYLVSTTDKEAVLDVAKSEAVDGVLAYASDPAAPTAAYVSERLGLPTNPYKAVETLCNKDKFRQFLQSHDFNTPVARYYDSVDDALNDKKLFRYPLIIKPVDSSGSKGVTVLHDDTNLKEALEFGFSFSRARRIIVEDFIEKKTAYLTGGDIFIKDGKVILWGLLDCHRDKNVNPLVPVGKSYPPSLDKEDLDNVKIVLQRLVDELEIKSGAMNVELIVSMDNKVWPIDIGPRCGGNMIPDLLSNIFGVDIVEMSIQSAMGEPYEVDISIPLKCYATFNLHSAYDGTFDSLEIEAPYEKYITKKCIYKKRGDSIQYFDNASKALGIIFFEFNNAKTMLDVIDNPQKWLKINLQK